MKKRTQGRQFSRSRGQRKALIKGLVSSLVLRGQIKTTLAKAKELRRFAEKFLSRAKKGDLAAIRYLNRYFSSQVVKKMINEIAPLFKSRPGGYTRITKLGQRKSDGAQIAIIEWVEKSVPVSAKKSIAKKKK